MTQPLFQSRHRRHANAALLLAVCALTIPAAPALASPLDWISGNSIQGSGKLQKQTREVGSFHGVALNVPGTVELRIGNTDNVTIEADDNILPLIETAVENGTLRIRPAKRNANFRQSSLTIVIQARQVERISVGGSGSITATGLRAEKLRFDVGGSGSIDARELDSRAVAVAIGGSGNFKADGATEQLSVAIGGSGGVEAGKLAAGTVQASIGGSGTAVVWARQTLAASIGGSGDIEYYGDPQLSRSVHGSGSVHRIGAAPR